MSSPPMRVAPWQAMQLRAKTGRTRFSKKSRESGGSAARATISPVRHNMASFLAEVTTLFHHICLNFNLRFKAGRWRPKSQS